MRLKQLWSSGPSKLLLGPLRGKEEIWTFYGINEPKMAVLLQHILVESDKASIRHLLEKKGITMQETLVDT